MSALNAVSLLMFAVLLLTSPLALADPTKYPQFAQQSLPPEIKPEFISVDTLAAEIKQGAKPVIVDVRSAEEFKEAHVSGALSAPLEQFRDHIKSIPKDRTAVLY
jgi:hypothetical protein